MTELGLTWLCRWGAQEGHKPPCPHNGRDQHEERMERVSLGRGVFVTRSELQFGILFGDTWQPLPAQSLLGHSCSRLPVAVPLTTGSCLFLEVMEVRFSKLLDNSACPNDKALERSALPDLFPPPSVAWFPGKEVM